LFVRAMASPVELPAGAVVAVRTAVAGVGEFADADARVV
jgi:hypothetical protein